MLTGKDHGEFRPGAVRRLREAIAPYREKELG